MRVGVHAIPYNYALRSARLRAGYTQAELAELAGMGIGTYSTIERLQRKVNEQEALDISMALGESVDELFPQETRNLDVNLTQSVDFVVEVDSLDQLPQVDVAGLLSASLEDQVELESSQRALERTFKDLLATLNKQERQVLELRYGFGTANGQGKTLEEVAVKLGVTRERIRQIESMALRRLRHPVRARRLVDHVRAISRHRYGPYDPNETFNQ